MVGQLAKLVHVWEARPEGHFDDGAVGWIKTDGTHALIHSRRLVQYKKKRLLMGHRHAFEQQELASECVEIADDTERVLKVIEQSKTEDEIEFPKR